MTRIVLSVVALFSLSLVACAGEAAEDGDVTLATDTQLSPEAVAAGDDTAPAPTVDDQTAEKGKKGKGKSTQEFLVVKLNDVLISSY